MVRPYRFGRVYAVINLLGAAFNLWLGWSMLTVGYLWVTVLALALAVVGAGSAIGLWRKRKYGFVLLCLSFACGVIAIIYGWFQPSEWSPVYRIVGDAGFFISLAMIFAYFYKRRAEFT